MIVSIEPLYECNLIIMVGKIKPYNIFRLTLFEIRYGYVPREVLDLFVEIDNTRAKLVEANIILELCNF